MVCGNFISNTECSYLIKHFIGFLDKKKNNHFLKTEQLNETSSLFLKKKQLVIELSETVFLKNYFSKAKPANESSSPFLKKGKCGNYTSIFFFIKSQWRLLLLVKRLPTKELQYQFLSVYKPNYIEKKQLFFSNTGRVNRNNEVSGL